MIATVFHLVLLLCLITTGVFEFLSAILQREALNLLVYQMQTAQFIFMSLVDLMICSVFWILTNENSRTTQKIRNKNHLDTSTDLQDDDIESLTSSTQSFGELMNRDSNMLMNSVHQAIAINSSNSNLYYEMITSQFIKDYLEESDRARSESIRDSNAGLKIDLFNRHESTQITVSDNKMSNRLSTGL